MFKELSATYLDAIESLAKRALVNYSGSPFGRVAPTPQGRAFLKETVHAEWQGIFKRFAAEEWIVALKVIAEHGQSELGRVVVRQRISALEMAKYLGWIQPDVEDWDKVPTQIQFRVYGLFKNLEAQGFAQVFPVAGNKPIQCTYAGIVRSTRQPVHEKLSLLQRLVEEWETLKVEFKRQVSVQDNDGKAEFIKDVLALANTVGKTGYFVIGIDEETRRPIVGRQPLLIPEQIDQLISAYCEPFINIVYDTIRYQDAEVELLTVLRDPCDVPYRVKKSIRGSKKEIKEGDVFVRHGRIVEHPTELELKDLEEESAKARTEA
jgi:hypothetical protein